MKHVWGQGISGLLFSVVFGRQLGAQVCDDSLLLFADTCGVTCSCYCGSVLIFCFAVGRFVLRGDTIVGVTFRYRFLRFFGVARGVFVFCMPFLVCLVCASAACFRANVIFLSKRDDACFSIGNFVLGVCLYEYSGSHHC